MKKLLFIPLALALLSSCEKITSDATEQPVDPESGPKIHLSFVAEQPTVKTFFDPTATAEAWEKTLSSVDALVFNAEGRLLVHRKFTVSELTSKSASFAVPNTAAGTACEFYVVANRPLSGLSTKAELLALIQSDAADYNGTFAEVSTRARRSGGFVMSGSASKTLAAAGSATDVAVTLRRCVAKIAVQTSLSAEFASRYSGKCVSPPLRSRVPPRAVHSSDRAHRPRHDDLHAYAERGQQRGKVQQPVLPVRERHPRRRVPRAADPRRDLRPRRGFLHDRRPSSRKLPHRTYRGRSGPTPS
ncbi:MAG: fimbrial protein [Alistipes indistinctus]